MCRVYQCERICTTKPALARRLFFSLNAQLHDTANKAGQGGAGRHRGRRTTTKPRPVACYIYIDYIAREKPFAGDDSTLTLYQHVPDKFRTKFQGMAIRKRSGDEASRRVDAERADAAQNPEVDSKTKEDEK